MHVSCSFCGGIHERGEQCKKRTNNKRPKKEANFITNFRSSRLWKKKALEIKKRDRYLCQVCLLDKYHTERIYNFHNLEVHHIFSIKDCYELRLNNWNLLTLCSFHHKLAENGNIPAHELKEIAVKNECPM